MTSLITFDHIVPRITSILEDSTALSLRPSEYPSEVWVIRDFTGRCRVLAPSEPQVPQEGVFLQKFAEALHGHLGAHAYKPDESLLPMEMSELAKLKSEARTIRVGRIALNLVDRLLTASDWTVFPTVQRSGKPVRFTLFSLKGGMGRSTTAAVLAQHLARRGYNVLLVDLDLESPGLSSALLEENERPDFGIVDWFVEDLVDQGDRVLSRMTARARWSQDLRGSIVVVPAHGRLPGEYLPKLGRVFLDRPPNDDEAPETWPSRLSRLLTALEEQEVPDVVIVDSRSGLHDIAAAVVAHIQAHVLLFCTDSGANWTGYRLLFDYWQAYQAIQYIRHRLSVVAALVPPDRSTEYLAGFRERAWDLFRDTMYDDIPPGEPEADAFSFDLADEQAPHAPLPIYWNPGLASLASLRDLEHSAVLPAYQQFLMGFEVLWSLLREE